MIIYGKGYHNCSYCKHGELCEDCEHFDWNMNNEKCCDREDTCIKFIACDTCVNVSTNTFYIGSNFEKKPPRKDTLLNFLPEVTYVEQDYKFLKNKLIEEAVEVIELMFDTEENGNEYEEELASEILDVMQILKSIANYHQVDLNKYLQDHVDKIEDRNTRGSR
jgi:NTP pyrophosphatase (non-canonical NTP hydrolase)